MATNGNKISSFVWLFIAACLHTSHAQEGPDLYNVIDPVHHELQWAGLWLAAHKYFDVDRRKGNARRWKYEERVYHKHFPLPRLKKLHPEAEDACSQGLVECARQVSGYARDSYSLSDLNKHDAEKLGEIDEKYESDPFPTSLELFQYRTTASYFMCWFTMQRLETLTNFMAGKPCLHNLDKVKERAWAEMKVVDFRNDTAMYPFMCAEMLFCPDPCYGKKTEGSVPSFKAMEEDNGNPCRKLKDPRCEWAVGRNTDFTALQKNKFNITCNCKKERKGFEWSSEFGMCVDHDECDAKEIRCRHGKVCQNTPGSFKCACRRGQRYVPKLKKCVEHVPMPEHSFSRSARVKAKRQKTALVKGIWSLFGLKSSKN